MSSNGKMEESMTHYTLSNAMNANSNHMHFVNNAYHTSTPSNNHLITKPSNVRHNQSFDNTENGGSVQGGMGGSNGGYDEIPDTFSHHQHSTGHHQQHMMQMNVNNQNTFANMPNGAFGGSDDVEDDNYARIDFADLNHSEMPSQMKTYPMSSYQANNGQPMPFYMGQPSMS